MKAVCSLVKLASCLLVVAFLITVAIGSDKIEHPSGTEKRVILTNSSREAARLLPFVMMAVYSSVKLVSCLLVIPFLLVVAFGSDKIEHPSETEKRSISYDDFISLHDDFISLHDDFISLQQEVKALRTQRATFEWTGGGVYTRWGRTVCNNGSDVVYDGVAGGSWFDVYGGGSNYICLPKDPIWGVYNESVVKKSKLYGSEYEWPTSFGLENNNGQPLQDHDVSCVVCQSQTKSSVVMIPARNQCYNGWHAEYAGYLMSGDPNHLARTEFICMDGSPEAVPGGEANENGAVFYNVEGACGSLPCPPYVQRREITCVVCSK